MKSELVAEKRPPRTVHERRAMTRVAAPRAAGRGSRTTRRSEAEPDEAQRVRGAAPEAEPSLWLAGSDEAHDETPSAPEEVVAAEVHQENNSALGMYFREMAQHRVLTAEEELRAVREIEELEIVLWERILSFVPALDYVLRIVEEGLIQTPAEEAASPSVPLAALRSLRQAMPQLTKGTPSVAARRKFTKAARKLAELLRASDVDKDLSGRVLAVLAHLSAGRPVTGHPSLSSTKAPVKAYLRQVGESNRAATGARERFIKANLRLVVSMARRYRRDLLSLGDLIQEGNIGLMKGVSRYDHRRGVKFSTYASWWIRHAINRALADKGREVRVPVHLIEAQKQVAKAQRELDSKLGRWATTEEVSEATKVPVEKIEKLRTYLREHSVSLDQPMGSEGDNDHGLQEIFSDPNQDIGSPLDSLASEEMSEKVGQVMRDVLKPMEVDILRRRFGFEDDHELTLKEIGAQYNLSRERVRQLQMQSLGKIRDALRRRQMI